MLGYRRLDTYKNIFDNIAGQCVGAGDSVGVNYGPVRPRVGMLRPAQPRLGKNRRIQNSLLPPPGPLVTWAPSLSSSPSSASLAPSSLSSKLNEVSGKKPV